MLMAAGKGLALPNRTQVADKVARGILGGLKKLVPASLVRRSFQANGVPGIVIISWGSLTRW